MNPKALLSRLPVDPYIAAIVSMVCLASVLPAHDRGAVVAGYATDCRHRAAVFPAWGAALTAGRFGGRVALAAARRRDGLDVRAVSGVGPWREGAVSGTADAAALDGRDPALRTAFDSPIVDRVHLDRARQRAGGALRRDRVQPAGHGIDAVADRAAARRAGRLLGAWRRRHRPPASAPLRRRPACSAVDRRLGVAAQDAARSGGSRIDPAGGLCRVQRGRHAGHLAPAEPRRSRATGGRGRNVAGDGAGDHHIWQPAAWLLPRR